jgi:type II secretory ATPase GspE/PulE/Tfp pilus assembly ATPase PilB-like protein
MVLICGPTGSGKTTTLYAIMNALNKPEVNMVSIEDPIEYNMRYVNQSQINPQAGVTFASGLRALLRQDPNVVMVGEIRDAETAGIAVQAALTGHLLLSSVHTTDAPTAVPRLFDLQIQPFLVSATLNVVFAQRLVRRICPSCIYSHAMEADVRKAIATHLKALHIPDGSVTIPKTVYRGKGCGVCAGIGYRGRLGIFEAMGVGDELREAIVSPEFTLERLIAEARKGGWRTMFEDGLEKIQLGVTTIDEVMRVISE